MSPTDGSRNSDTVSLSVHPERPWAMGSFKALVFRALKLPIPQDFRAAQTHSAAELLQRVVPRQHLRVRFAEVLRELFGDIHGPMLAAGATDGNGQVTAICLRELA